MKPLQLPKNKLARLAINVGFVWLWLLPIISVFISNFLISVLPLALLFNHYSIIYLSFVFIPIILVTRYIWWGPIKSKRLTNIFLNKGIWGRLKPKPRITRSKD